VGLNADGDERDGGSEQNPACHAISYAHSRTPPWIHP
jgi:hypothetical protein